MNLGPGTLPKVLLNHAAWHFTAFRIGFIIRRYKCTDFTTILTQKNPTLLMSRLCGGNSTVSAEFSMDASHTVKLSALGVR